MTLKIFPHMKDTISDNVHIMINKNELKKRYAMTVYYIKKSEQEKEEIRKLMKIQAKLGEIYQQGYINAQENAEMQFTQMKIAEQKSEKEAYDFSYRAYKVFKNRMQKMQILMEEALKQLGSLKKVYQNMTDQLQKMQSILNKQLHDNKNNDKLEDTLKLFVI
ncbi:hypothetical protein [Oceanobacillus sp. CFH 90083]|uniref:hypothetical protein n=1 Tax=Oceanobacillus sp. CFH 90083 TaxID=2592336 RepID=UPI00128E8668|nr:hypothetical protein [Oceanobacillus sp. CFH 90083]